MNNMRTKRLPKRPGKHSVRVYKEAPRHLDRNLSKRHGAQGLCHHDNPESTPVGGSAVTATATLQDQSALHIAKDVQPSCGGELKPSAGTGRIRRRYDEIERGYQCKWNGCDKAYGTLTHLNAHVAAHRHGDKRLPVGECRSPTSYVVIDGQSLRRCATRCAPRRRRERWERRLNATRQLRLRSCPELARRKEGKPSNDLSPIPSVFGVPCSRLRGAVTFVERKCQDGPE